MTFEQAFQKIKSKFNDADTSKLDSFFAIQVNMTDEDCGGAFYIQFADGKLNVEPYDYRDNTSDVTLKKLDLYKILDLKLTVAKALETGKIIINGSADDFAAAISCIKPVPVKKAAAKTAKKTSKPAAKTTKATAKSETKPVSSSSKAAEKTAVKPVLKADEKKTTKK